MSDLNKIQSAPPIIVSDGISQEASLGSAIPVGSETALMVRDACKGQQTSANSRPVVLASDQSDVGVNIDKYGGTSTTLGQKAMASSIPVTIASDQSDVGVNIDKYGGTATTLGQKAMAASIPVVLASDQSAVTVAQATAANLNATIVGNKTNNNAAPGANNVGVLPALANAAAPTYTEGDQVLLSTDLGGAVRVNVVSSASGGTSATDKSTFTEGTSLYTPIGGDFNDSGTFPTNGQGAAARITGKRALHANLRDNSGNELIGQKTMANSVPVTIASDQSDIGINIDKYGGTATTLGQKVMAASIPVTLASDQSAITVTQATASSLNAQVQGNVASGAADSGNPVKIGIVGHTAQPTAVTDGQRVDAIGDKVGRQVVTLMQVRDLKTNSRTSISNTTETTVLAAVASTFLDITQIIITNTSNTKDANIDFRDSTGGTIRVTIHAPALATTVVNFADILTQATVNNNWTATSDSSTATLSITVLAIKNI